MPTIISEDAGITDITDPLTAVWLLHADVQCSQFNKPS